MIHFRYGGNAESTACGIPIPRPNRHVHVSTSLAKCNCKACWLWVVDMAVQKIDHLEKHPPKAPVFVGHLVLIRTIERGQRAEVARRPRVTNEKVTTVPLAYGMYTITNDSRYAMRVCQGVAPLANLLEYGFALPANTNMSLMVAPHQEGESLHAIVVPPEPGREWRAPRGLSGDQNCTCPAEAHACPYQEDIHGNGDEDYCTCCTACQRNCLDDI